VAETTPSRPTIRANLPRATVSQPLGVLAVPASGRVVRAWGDKMPGGAKSESVTFATRSGAQVSAPISGTVEFAGPFRSYGQLLILSTSDGYHVLLWGMSSNYVSVGQSVKQGEPIARMADRASGEPELFMEVRKGGEPMNPAKWMKRG
jgi:septal ring factor EnvC (AmiA/AmiB activator)